MTRRFQFSTPAPYRSVEAQVRDRGLFTGMQPLGDEGLRLVCASNGGEWGLGGISYWISLQQGRWFIASWAPCYYEVPADADIADVVVEAVRAAVAHPRREYFDMDDAVKGRFGLVEVTDEAFQAICGL